MNKNLPIVIIGLIGVVAVIGGVILWANNNSKKPAPRPPITNNNTAANSAAQTQAALERFRTAPAGASPAWSKGAPNAVVTLEEYADFQCPSCANYQPVLKEIRTVYGDKVRIVFRQYPLQMHNKALDASRATEAAGMQGKFWEMHDLIYQKQKDWSLASADHRKEFESYAKTIGLDLDKYNADINTEAANKRVSLDRQRGDFIGIRATPSLFLNGRLLLPDEMEVKKLRGLIDAALQGR